MQPWLQAVRPLAQLNLAIPVLFGEAFAFYATGRLWLMGALWAHAFALSAQPAILFANDLADEEADVLCEKSTLLAGGSRVLVDGKLSRAALVRGMWVAWSAHLFVGGLAALWLAHWLPLACAALTLALTHAYSFAPLRLSYRGVGGIVQGLGTGVVLPVVGCCLGARNLLTPPWMILLATFVLSWASNWITSIPDAERDRLAHKASMAGRWGARQTAVLSGVVVFAVSLSGFSPHGRLAASGMQLVTFGCWLALLPAAWVIWHQPHRQVLMSWLLLGSVQVLWVGWCAVLVTQAG